MRALVVIALCATVYSVGVLNLTVLDYDEAAYAEVSRGMYERGDLLVPELGGKPFFEKPPMLYWGQILGYHIFGVNELGARFFNTVAGVLLLLVLYGLGRRALGARVALRAVLLLGTSIAIVAVARVALTDLWLTLWLVASLGCAHHALETGRARWMYAAATAAGLAMLTKGAIGLLLPGGALLLYAAITGQLRKLLSIRMAGVSLLIAIGVGASWYLLLGITQPGGFGFMRELFVEHHVDRFLEPAHKTHQGPIYLYLLVLLAGTMPWSFFLLASLRRRLWPEPSAGRRLLLLFALFSALTLVLFSLAATKLPNYVTPIYPFLALLIAVGLERVSTSEQPDGQFRFAARLTTVGLFLMGGVCVAAHFVMPKLPDMLGPGVLKSAPSLAWPIDLSFWPFVIAAPFFGAGLWLALRRRASQPTEVIWPAAAAFALSTCVLCLTILPRIDYFVLRPLHRVAQYAALLDPKGGSVAMVGLKYTPSANFYGGRPSHYVSPRRPTNLKALFHQTRPTDVITTSAYVERVRAHGPIKELLRARGYVLLRCLPTRHADGDER